MVLSRLLSVLPRLPKLKPRRCNASSGLGLNFFHGFPRDIAGIGSNYDNKKDSYVFPSLSLAMTGIVGLSLDQEDPNTSEDEDVELSDANDNSHEESFMEDKSVFDKCKLEMIAGDKEGSEWLVLDSLFILHRYRSLGNQTFWECSGRRAFNCPFKATTIVNEDDDEKLELVYMYKLDRHDCGQTKMGPILQKFRNKLKMRMSDNFKSKFHTVFAEEKKLLLNQYKDAPDLLERIVYEIKDKRTYRVCSQRARAKRFPKNPTCSEEMDLDLIGLKRFELGRSSHFDPNVKDKEIILLGTPLSAKAWAQSEFKSGDGTFKICPKQFYQVCNPSLKDIICSNILFF